MSKFKNIVCLFVTEVVQDFEGGVKIGGTGPFNWGFLIKIHTIMKKSCIWKSEMLMLYKEIPPKTMKKGVFISKIVLFGTFYKIPKMLLTKVVKNC